MGLPPAGTFLSSAKERYPPEEESADSATGLTHRRQTKRDLHAEHTDLFYLRYNSRLRLLGDVAQGGERHGIVDRHLGEHLAVDLDAGDLQTMHEAGVIHAVGLAGGGDAGDPQLTEVPLLQAAAHPLCSLR